MQFKSFLYSLQTKSAKDPDLHAAFQYAILRIMMILSTGDEIENIEALENFLMECSLLFENKTYTEKQYRIIQTLVSKVIEYLEMVEEDEILELKRLIIKIYNNEKKAVQEKESI